MCREHTSDLHSDTRSRLVHRVLWTIICVPWSRKKTRYRLLRINHPAGCETVCNHKQISLHAYLTICSETCLFWNLTGRSRMGFTVKHWMSACRKVKGLNDDQFRRHLLQLDFCLIFNSTQYINTHLNVYAYKWNMEFTNV